MPEQVGVRTPEDDWTGSTDATLRRTRQNRLHQRKWRQSLMWPTLPRQLANYFIGQRQKAVNMSKRMDPQISTSILPSGPTRCLSTQLHHTHLYYIQNTVNPSRYFDREYRHHLLATSLSRSHPHIIIEQVENVIFQGHTVGSPYADLLLTLVHFNVFRALVSNTFSLGFNFNWLTGDAVSTFCQIRGISISWECPVALRPTSLQIEVAHHPWIDLFPFPRLRDNILRQGENYDDDELCYDLVEVCHAPSDRSGLIVWGEPWDPLGWEATSEFVRKWGLILTGCQDLLRSTNYWRATRGEAALSFEAMD